MPVGQAVLRELLPGVAAVARDVEAAAGAAALHVPREPPRLPEAGEEDVGVRGIDGDVGRAGVAVLLQDLLPRLAAVARAVDAALGVRAERVAEHRRERDVGVLRVHDHRADLPFLLPDVRPGLAGVGRLVDAVAGRDVAADVGLAGADVDDVGIARRDRDRSDRRDRLVVEDGLPGRPAVGRLPDAARRGGGVVDQRVPRHARRARHASAGGGADVAVLERLECLRGFGLVGLRGVLRADGDHERRGAAAQRTKCVTHCRKSSVRRPRLHGLT